MSECLVKVGPARAVPWALQSKLPPWDSQFQESVWSPDCEEWQAHHVGTRLLTSHAPSHDAPLKTPPSTPSLTIAVGLASLPEARQDGSNPSLSTGCQSPAGLSAEDTSERPKPQLTAALHSPCRGCAELSLFREASCVDQILG